MCESFACNNGSQNYFIPKKCGQLSNAEHDLRSVHEKSTDWSKVDGHGYLIAPKPCLTHALYITTNEIYI